MIKFNQYTFITSNFDAMMEPELPQEQNDDTTGGRGFFGRQGPYGCSCSLGCGELLLLVLLTAIAAYMVITRFVLR